MLTDRQQEILTYLRKYQQDQGVMPSTREIQHYFGFASQTAAVSHLRALEKRGFLHRLPNKARAVILADSEKNTDGVCQIPVFGAIPAGRAEDSSQSNTDTMTIDLIAMGIAGPDPVFALRVHGDSMIGAHITSGDLLILQKREPAHNDIVAALIDGESTLKRYVIQNGTPYLQAENPDFPDLFPLQELLCQGVMVGLVRGQKSRHRW